MPTYDYECKECGTKEEHVHSMKEDPEIRCKCGGVMKRLISLNFGGFILKGGTPAIHDREKRNRKKRSVEMDKRQRARYGEAASRIHPNVAGVRTDSWTDAQKMAKEAGMNSESYKPWVEKEKKDKKKLII